MPELPEVETIVNALGRSSLIGRIIKNMRLYWPRTISYPAPVSFRKKILGTTITKISRRAKFIVLSLSSGNNIIIHLRMSGKIYLVEQNLARNKHEHIIITLDDNTELRFHDTRKFGRWVLTTDLNTFFQNTGIEPLSNDFTIDRFRKLLRSKKRMLKALLLDQSCVAGLGNIYVDESLWHAGIHPLKVSSAISSLSVKKLHSSIIRTLKKGVKNCGTSLGDGEANYYGAWRHRGRNQDRLFVFRRTGFPCPRCKTPIKRIFACGRGTHICPKCQKIKGL